MFDYEWSLYRVHEFDVQIDGETASSDNVQAALWYTSLYACLAYSILLMPDQPAVPLHLS